MPSDNIPPENDTGNTSDHPETAPSMTSKGRPNTRPRKPRKKTGSASGTQTMNPEVDTGPTKAVWTVADVFKLLQYLIDQKPRAGDGGSYPMAIYNEAAVECNKIRSQGANKTGAMCKNKWSTGLRPIWKICREIDTRSGLGGFDTEKGAHITAESEHVWADFVKSNPSVAPYKHKGWVYWDKMAELLGSPPPRGHRVFRASQMIDTRAISPTWDIENENNNLPGDSQNIPDDASGSGTRHTPDIFGAELAQTSNSAPLVSGLGSQPAPGFTSQVDRISGRLGIRRAPSMFNSHTSRASSISGSQSLAAGDDDDSQDSYETPTPTPGPSRKREAADSLPSTAKKTRLSSGSQAIGLIGAAMDRFTDAMIDVIAPPPPVVQPGIPMMSASTSNVIGTPRSLRRQVALARVQDEALTVDDRVDLFEMFEKDSVLVESYLAFTIPELRENWIKRKLNALQGYV